MKALLIILCTVLCTSCATMGKIQDHQLNKTHEWAYHDALDVIASAIPSKELTSCGFIFLAPLPPTTQVKSVDQMELEYGKRAQGLYLPKTKEVIYVKGADASSTLTHEYTHYIYDISNLSEYCKNQAFAYMVQYANSQRLAMERWRRAYERERNKQRSRVR